MIMYHVSVVAYQLEFLASSQVLPMVYLSNMSLIGSYTTFYVAYN